MYSRYLSVYIELCDSALSVIDLNRLDSVLCSDQCALQYCFRLLNSVVKIFLCTVILSSD